MIKHTWGDNHIERYYCDTPPARLPFSDHYSSGEQTDPPFQALLFQLQRPHFHFLIHFQARLIFCLISGFSALPDYHQYYSAHYFIPCCYFISGIARGAGWLPPGRNSAHSCPPKWNYTLYRGLWRAAILSPSQPHSPLRPPHFEVWLCSCIL